MERSDGSRSAAERARGADRAAVDLRPAGPADVDVVARIWRTGWAVAHLGHVPAALVAARTATSFGHRALDRVADTIVALRGGELVGFVMIDDDQVDHLYLDGTARGSGLGAVLLGAAEHAIVSAGHESAWLAVATGNAGARRFYARAGWTDDGPFVHDAPVPGGTVAVHCHRFVSPRRSDGEP